MFQLHGILEHMSGKIIAAIVGLIILIGGGVYYYSLKGSTPADAQAAAAAGAATTTPQVAGQDAVIGTGAVAEPGMNVAVLYVGMLQDGTVFDSSANNGNQPLQFTLGAEGIIPGFQIGVNGMKEGGERRISVPPELGYGTEDVKDPTGKVIIPANSTLIFDVKLVAAAAPTAPTAQ